LPQRRKRLLVHLEGRGVIGHQDDPLRFAVRTLPRQCLGGRDMRGLVQRVAEHAATDRRERDRRQAQFLGQLQRFPVAVGQQRRLIAQAVLPHRAHRVQHVLCWQVVAGRGAHFTGRAAHARADLRQRRTLGQQLRAGRAMDRPIHATPAKQGLVGRIDDRIHRQGRDVALPHFDLHACRSFYTGSIQRDDCRLTR